MNSILVIAELFDGQIRQVTYELISAAEKTASGLSKKNPDPDIQACIKIAVLSNDCQEAAEILAQKTGLDVIGVEAPGLDVYTAERYINHLDLLFKTINPGIVIAAHSSQGRDFAPGLAVQINAEAIAGVCQILLPEPSDMPLNPPSDGWGLTFVRPVLNSTQNMWIRPMGDVPVVLTIAPGSFAPFVKKTKTPGRISLLKQALPQLSERVKPVQIKKKPVDNQELTAAEIIVAAGQGIQNKKNLEWIYKLSECFDKSAVGASRPVVDMGWLSYAHQVGITGATVSPRLYLACGISGSSQHLAGIKHAKTIVCINKNPDAPICQHADLCIAEDAIEFIQAFLDKNSQD